MGTYKIPTSVPETYRYLLTDLLGVDYNDTVADNRRSPRMENIVNNNGFLETRKGHKVVTNINNQRINGVWNYDNDGVNENVEVFIVHAGTELYKVSSDWRTKTLLKTGLNDAKSSGVNMRKNLLIFDGKRALVYQPNGIHYLDEAGSIPLIMVGLKPDASGGTTLRGPNLLTHTVKVSYCGTATDTVYQLPGASWTRVDAIRVVKEDGTVLSNLTTSQYSYNNSTGRITFTEPYKTQTEGMDNITVTFTFEYLTYEHTPLHTEYINGCNIATTFGYGGNNNRIFVTGYNNEANGDWFSYVEDPLDFPEDNWTKMGDSPVMGYSRAADGTLVVHKKLTDTDATVYYRTYNSVNGKDIFPIKSGVKNIGCLNDKCCQNFLNDPVFLSENGIYSIINESSVTDTKYAEDRSYYIKSKLLAEPNLEDAVAIVNGTKYYLAINNHVYVADKRFLSTSQYAGSNYQYEWFYFTDVPVRVWFNWNNTMYWGDNNGNIRTWQDSYYDELLVDGQYQQVPIKVYWESEPLFLNDYAQAKTVRKIYVHHNPIGASRIKLGYKDNDGEHEVSTSEYTGTEVYPRVIQEKEKISKIMWFKPTIQNDRASRCSFNSIVIEYRIAGKYRGD